MPDTILDAYGAPAHFSNAAYEGLRNQDGLRVSHPNAFSDWSALLPRERWQLAVSDCRWIGQSCGVVAGAKRQKSEYVVASGLLPIFEGDDDAWGSEAEDLIEQADKIAGVRGPRFTTKELARLTVEAWATDGAAFWIPTEKANGFPALQVLEAHRVGSRHNEPIEKEGRFKGSHVRNGIYYDQAGQEIGYRILGYKSDGSEDKQLDQTECWHVARPNWLSEGRPLPEIAPAVLDLYDLREGVESAKMQAIIDSRLTMVESNATGKADPSRSPIAPPSSARTQLSGAQTEVIDRGAIRYIKNGNTLTPWQASRPSDQWQRFMEYLSSTAMYAMGWRNEMRDLSKLGGSTTRAFQDQINTTILSAFNALAPFVIRWRQYQVAKLIKRGNLRAHPQWYMWGCATPPEFTCDPSRSINSDLEAVRAGAESMPRIHSRWGYRSRRVLDEQGRYLRWRREAAKRWGVTEQDLGRTDKPGDMQQVPQGSAPQPNQQQDQQQDSNP